ncbi:peptidylprolyl isomerase [Paucibacter sp. APW11]|uniref:Peptidyl-prolyl cis-trans isomerase n=1 Tax=Roseateles aquae TaxID=3077235 RepID=A0ABU3PH13_9BURK|nr:peptidylprolyl isomerase [Paucibacter sp. APW11]MDT9001685.1 peptidylprolyl isomerase [Paucibacter sp. APW11]
MSNKLLRRIVLLCTVLALSACGGGGHYGDHDHGGGTPLPVPNPNPWPNTNSCSNEGLAKSALSPYPTVCMLTSSGEMVFELYPSYAPQTVSNFLRYVADGFYNRTLVHHVDRDFVFQGGGYSSGMFEKRLSYAPIASESNNGLSNLRGTLAMAWYGDADHAAAQFFVNVLNNTSLDYQSRSKPGYTVFGRVISGLATMDAINAVPIYFYSSTDIEPRQEVLIYWVQRLK